MDNTREHGTEPRARAAERRRETLVHDAAAKWVGPELAHELHEALPDVGDDDPPEGAAAKLVRLRDSPSGRDWLRTHPDASWDDLDAANI